MVRNRIEDTQYSKVMSRTCYAHSRALATDHVQALLVCRGICFKSLYACTYFDGFAGIIGAVIIPELDFLKMMRPYSQRAISG